MRKALQVKEGDEIAYRIEHGRVITTKAIRGVAEDPFVTFDEWASDADTRAYAKL